MSQVIIEMTRVSVSSSARDTPVSHFAADVEEITSSGTSQSTTILTEEDEKDSVVTVINNGTDAIWVNFGAAAAVGVGRFIPPSTTRDFGNVRTGVAVHVINDS